MRVFFAISIPDDVKARLIAAVQRLSSESAEIAWMTRDQLHLTLAFLGEISPAILPHMTAAAERVFSAQPAFTCRAYGLGFFGNRRNPKTLWAGVDPCPELDVLHEGLWHELKKIGYTDDTQDFRPHITLGRGKSAARNQNLTDAMDADEDVAFGEWTVKRVTLFESRLTPRGAIYRALSHMALAGT